MTVSARLSIATTDDPLFYENVSSESLSSSSFAPPVEPAASSCLRRCYGMAGRGLALWELDVSARQSVRSSNN